MAPKVVALFLIHFDIRSGYELVWSHTTADISLDGLDYKLLPSGIHNFSATTVMVSHLDKGTLYYGLGRFRQHIVGKHVEGEQIDRKDVQMYSLGILCEPVHSDWRPNEYSNNGWEYIDFLDARLNEFLDTEKFGDFSIFERTFAELPQNQLTNIHNHLLTKLADFFTILGPLVFVAHKQALLRKRILISNKNTDYFAVNAFTYVLALLASIPKNSDLNDLPHTFDSFPIYTIGLPDMLLDLIHTKGYIALTNDDILLEQKDLYDIAIVLHENQQGVEIRDSQGNIIRATQTDYANFKTLYRELFGHAGPSGGLTNHLNISTDDLSLHTTYSVSTAASQGCGNLIGEPVWWAESTELRLWSGLFWNAFLWFASAGAALKSDPLMIDGNIVRSVDLMQLVNLVGSFHRRTSRYIFVVKEVIDEQHGSLELELTYRDLADMGLDPYSHQDWVFVQNFTVLYWKEVSGVSIGVGSICC